MLLGMEWWRGILCGIGQEATDEVASELVALVDCITL